MDPLSIYQKVTQKQTKNILNFEILSTETSPMSHVTATVMGGSSSYWSGIDPKIKKNTEKIGAIQNIL